MTLHRQIHLDFRALAGVTVGDQFDDNFFSLRAGESRIIGFTLRGGTGSGEPRFAALGMNAETKD